MTAALVRRSLATPAGLLGAALAAVAVAHVLVTQPSLLRPLLAVLLAGGLFVLSTLSPTAAIVLAFWFLPFLALVRRLLIPVAGWSGSDPLLLVGPLLAVALFVRLFVLERRTLAPDRLSKLIAVLLGLALLQSVNPLGGSLVAGLGGLLFVAAPLLWFFVGRELVDARTMNVLVLSVLVAAAAAAFYGIAQTQRGFQKWDSAWLELSGYASLNVGGVIRPFATFSSSAEYAVYVAIALVVAIAFLLHGRLPALLVVPLFGAAVFMVSSRGIVVLSVFACLVLVALRTGNARVAIATVVCGLLAAVGATQLMKAPEGTARSTNPLVAHQVGGLSDPLDPEESTLLLHWRGVLYGFREGVTQPIGWGTAATNIAGSKLGGEAKGSEVDITDAFIALGLPGGILFILIVLGALRRAWTLALARPSPVVLAIAGMLLVALGQWLNGGYYAVAPLLWLSIGWIARADDAAGGEA